MRPQQQGQQVGAAALQPQLLQLYGRPSSLNVQKVLWCCEELALPFTLLHASAILGPGARSAVAAAAIAMGQPGPFCLSIVHLLTDSTGDGRRVGARVWLNGRHSLLSDANPSPRVNSAEYRTMNPHGRIPVLRCGGAQGGAIYESSSIMRYLCRKYDARRGDMAALFGPTPEAEADASKWMDWMLEHTNGALSANALVSHTTRLPLAQRR
jgi:glutathione S-transferase